MNVIFRRLHLYLALAAGLVFFVQCLTGTVLVFEEEITHALYPAHYGVVLPAGQPRLALAQLASQFQQANPEAKVLGFKVYADPARTVELSFREDKARPAGPLRSERGGREPPPRGQEGGEGRGEGGRGPQKGRPERGSTAFVNPYTAQVVGLQKEKQLRVFKFAEDLHRRLLAGEVGKALTGISALFILVITATGIVLWWPKTRAMLTGRLRIKWGSSGKRITHDLHIVLGFYCSLFLFGLAFTGVIMSYRWATNGLFWLTNSRPTVGLPTLRSAAEGGPAIAYDAALRAGQATHPTADFWRIGAPKDPTAAIPVSAPSTLPLRSLGLDTLFVDRATGAVLGQHPYSRQTAGAQLRRLTKPLHTGEIGGIWTKILALVVTLCSLTFPVTGVLMWLRRTRKARRKQGRVAVVG
ncbi:hypothetical protein A0257_15580 [Hymenobacter psoromatis]|nr:hypothetical protein A0257_15580 [Hymenobacter psoromatis]